MNEINVSQAGKFEIKCLQCGESVVVKGGDVTFGYVGVTSLLEGEVRLWCKCGNGVTIE